MAKMYFQGETVRQKVEVTDTDRVCVDPDTIVISIFDTTGVKKVDSQTMTHDSTGKYSFDYLIPTDAILGLWTVEIKAELNFIAIEQDQFTVLDSKIT